MIQFGFHLPRKKNRKKKRRKKKERKREESEERNTFLFSRYNVCVCMNLCLYLAARSVSICFHDRMLALILRLDFPVSGCLVEDDHHARTLEDSVFCHLVAVSVHVTFVDRRRLRVSNFPGRKPYLPRVRQRAHRGGHGAGSAASAPRLSVAQYLWRQRGCC